MESRVSKYDNDEPRLVSRTQRNAELYKEINKEEIDNFEVRSNATVIGNSENNIDVEKIKSILDTHYNDAPKRKSIQLDDENVIKEEPKTTSYETKEYDINVILDKAREERPANYDEERSKKLHDTQFDILNNLSVDPKDYIEDYEEEDSPEKKENKELQNLINTITLNEKELKEGNVSEDSSPLDIFEDLKGDDNTTVLEGLQEKTKEQVLEEVMDKKEEEIQKTTSFDESFFTKKSDFKDKDFEEFEDLEETEGSGVLSKIIIGILVLIFIAGVVILVKSLL